MKASDKICVAPHQIFDYDLDIQEVGHNGAEEYIRKDALLKWLNQMLEVSAQSLEFQRNYAYGKVIDKLNEM